MPAWLLLLRLAHAEEPLPSDPEAPIPGRIVGLITSTDPALPWGEAYGSGTGRREGGPPVVYHLSVGGRVIVPYVEDPQLTGVNPLDDWTAGGTLPRPYDAAMFAPGANPFGIEGPAHVVAIEINGGAGAAPGAVHVVITEAQVIDRRRGYRLDVPAALADLRKRFDADAGAHEAELRAAATASCEGVKSANPGGGPWSGPDLASGAEMTPSWWPGDAPLHAVYVRTLAGAVERPSEAAPCPAGAPCAALPAASFPCGAAQMWRAEVSKRGKVVRYAFVGPWVAPAPR